MGTLRADGPRTVAVVRKDGSVEADRSVGFRNITVVGVVGRVAFGFLYLSAVARIDDVPWAHARVPTQHGAVATGSMTSV
ncbi:MAG TPA: hypothetical protein VLA55_03375, partial [Ornithinibacter sp.]|nr:hypothetical protein [Ornithinibacter sp.]